MSRQELLHTLCRLWMHPSVERDEMVKFQNRKLRHLVRHAYEHVFYYRRLFDRAGINPENIRTVGDLSQIPITEKNDLRACAVSGVLARGAVSNRLVKRFTSGSSGRPFVVRRSHFEEHVINMFRIRAKRQFGLRFHDRIAEVVVTVIADEKRQTFLTRLRQGAGIHRSYGVDCLQPASAICRRLEELDPDIIQGYAGAIAHVAPLAEGKFTGKRLRHIICGGEALTPLKRKTIEHGFGVRVFDLFGAHECNLVAWECVETGLHHVCDDNIIVEVLRDGQPAEEGEKGEVVITALHSYAMPFVRYRMGDVVVKGPEACPCGQPFSTFQKIEGRVREYFLLPDGRRVHPLEVVLRVITENAPWLDQFQMTQETETRFVLRLVPLRTPGAQELEVMRELVINRLGLGAEFRLELVDYIPFEPSGKFKDCRCLIPPDDEATADGQ